MERVLKYLLYFLFLPFWWLQIFISRNSNIWVFGAWYGNRFADNSRSLFLYINENHPEIKPIWITRDKEIVHTVRSKGFLAYDVHSIKGIWYSLRAKNIFVSSGKKDINPLFIHGANWIQLWHGSPAKKIGLDDKFSTTNTFFQKIIVRDIFPFASELNYCRIVSNAPYFTPILASAFGLGTDCVIEKGSPRNDVFYCEKLDNLNLVIREKYPNCKLIYYLPTFRKEGQISNIFELEDYDENTAAIFLENHNYVLISKGHYVDNKISEIGTDVSRIIHLADSDVEDINYMLKDADLLITDYSSIYFDFLLTEKPVIFAAFDLHEYISGDRELPFEYKDIISGPIVTSWHELYYELPIIWDNSAYKNLVKIKNRQFNKYHDSNNTKRVYEAVLQL